VEASSESPLGMGYVPNLPEMAHYIATDANAKVSYAMAAAIDKDPANIKILESVPNPNNLNDQRQIMHYKGIPYYYNNNRRSIWYGSQTNGRWIPTRTFQAYMARGEKPPVF
jgi:diphthamide synthase subunit DPH2